MTVRNIKKNLAGAEDLLHGIGVETQSRGGAFYDMHKLDTYVPTYDIEEMKRSSLTFMRLYGTDTAYTDYRRNPIGTIGIPSDLSGVWEPIQSSELPVCGNFTYGAYVFSSDCIVGYNDSFMQWQGDTPKVVAAGATPTTSGGIGTGAWVDRTDVTESGSGLVGYQPVGTGAVATTVQSKLRETVSVKDFGAVGNWNGVTGADDTVAFQAAFDACPPGGEILIPTGNGERYRLTDEIRVTKPVLVRGSSAGNVYADYSASSFDSFAGVQQTNTSKAAFKLVASLENFAYSKTGIINVHFKDLMISGPSSVSMASAAITTDTTVNGGHYHIRHCHMDNVAIRFFTTGVDYTGVAYLNTFVNCLVYNCTTGWKIAKGMASEDGGQTRWFGCTGIACGTVVSLNEDGAAGSFAFFGCTLSDSQYGIRADEECVLTISGCEFESLHNSGSGAGIYIEIKEDNPNSGAAKTIVSNKFLSSDADIWINKTSTAFAGGGFGWPMLIDGNTLNSATALKITVPSGHTGIDSKQFVFGAANAGPNGPVGVSQISTNFLGYDERTWAPKVAPSGTVVGTSDTQTLSGKTFNQNSLQLKGTAFQDVTYSINLSSGTTGNFTRLQFSDNGGSGNIASITGYGSGYGAGLSSNLVFATQGVNRAVVTSAALHPAADNIYTLGVASARWSTVYAATGTINTSDERSKDQITDLNDAERRVAVRIKGLIKTFKFKDAIAEKGDEARIHAGVVAQDVADAFKAEGLDPSRYALFCHDTWEDQYEPVFEEREVSDETTGLARTEKHKVGDRLVMPAGDRYGVRYEELLAFVIAAL